MIVHNLDPVLVDFGFFQLRWYSIAYILGITIGWMYAAKIIKISKYQKYKFNTISNSNLDDLIIYLIIGIIIGGRLGYVFFYNFNYYSQNIFEIFKLWHGGMSFHGGLLGVIILTIFYSKKKKLNFFISTDIISCAAPIGLFFGRIANFINGELYGKVSSMPWAVIFQNANNIARHPSQIYEAILEGLFLFIIINYLAFKKKLMARSGYISGMFLIFYSIFRIISEFFREPDIQIGYFFNYLSLGTLLSIITLIFGFLIIFSISKNE
jgi:phosphatidylglycerol---prolipoprotein diacylglyceryl transferase